MQKIISGLIIAFVVALVSTSTVFALSQKNRGVTQEGVWGTYELLDNVIANATSSARTIAGAKSITLYVENDGPNGSGVGTSTITFQVSLDGTTYFDYNKLITNNTSLTRASSAILTGTTTASYVVDLSGESYYTFRAVSVEAGTTTVRVDALIQY